MSVVSAHTLIRYVRASACTVAVRTGTFGAGCVEALVVAGAADELSVVVAVELVAADEVGVPAGLVPRVPLPDLTDEHAVRAASTATTATIRRPDMAQIMAASAATPVAQPVNGFAETSVTFIVLPVGVS